MRRQHGPCDEGMSWCAGRKPTKVHFTPAQFQPADGTWCFLEDRGCRLWTRPRTERILQQTSCRRRGHKIKCKRILFLYFADLDKAHIVLRTWKLQLTETVVKSVLHLCVYNCCMLLPSSVVTCTHSRRSSTMASKMKKKQKIHVWQTLFNTFD